VRRVKALALVLALSTVVTVGCSSRTSSPAATGAVSGEAVMSEKCTRCHSLDRIQVARKSAAGWKATVSRMQGHGLQISDAEKAAVVEYLSKAHGQ
jgi:hypothetical protein